MKAKNASGAVGMISTAGVVARVGKMVSEAKKRDMILTADGKACSM